MSSVDTVYFGEVPYYANLDDSRLDGDQTINIIDFSQQSSTQQDKHITKKSLSEKKDESSDLSNVKTPDEQKIKTPRQKVIVSLLPDYLARKTQSRREQITIYFFNSDKKMTFPKEELNKFFENKPIITIRQLIPYVVNCYCKLLLNFQPIQISEQSFELKLANLDNHDDPAIDPYPHNLDIKYLYDADNLILIRKSRPTDKINDWVRLFGDKSELEIIEILMPEKKELTLQIQRNKTVNTVKQKIASYSSQFGKIVLISYHGFKICQNKRKIADLDEKIFEVYRQKVQDYVDRPVRKNNEYSFTNVKFYEDLWNNSTKNQEDLNVPLEFFVNETTIFGKLTLCLHKSEIIEKYNGGLMSSFPLAQITNLLSKTSEERANVLSIHTLIGIKNTQSEELMLKFMYKDRYETKTYKFEFKEKKQNFLKSLLKVGRIYNKNWNKIV